MPRSWALGFLEARTCVWYIEQPLNSLFYWMAEVRTVVQNSSAERILTWLGAFGHATAKALEVYSTVHEAQMYLHRTKQQANERIAADTAARGSGSGSGARKRPAAASSLAFETPKSESASGSGTWRRDRWVTGRHQLMHESQEYPAEFAEFLAKTAVDHYKRAVGAFSKSRTGPQLKQLQ